MFIGPSAPGLASTASAVSADDAPKDRAARAQGRRRRHQQGRLDLRAQIRRLSCVARDRRHRRAEAPMPIDRQKLIESVDRRSSLEFVARMVRFKSYSNTAGEVELARFMAQAMRELGL